MQTQVKNNTIVVFTGKSLDNMLEIGGSASWVLNYKNAVNCQYLVCCRSDVSWREGAEAKDSAFLVGKISDIVPSPEPGCANRWLIKISDYAKVSIPGVWRQWRNPVRYTSLEALEIDVKHLVFKPVPLTSLPTDILLPITPKNSQNGIMPLTITDAKRGLALMFEVKEEAIEIIIRS